MDEKMDETKSQPQNMPVFMIEKIYIKDISLEIPNAPAAFLETASPETGIQLQIAHGRLGDDLYDSRLTVTVTAKLGEKTAFLIEVAQCGIFRIQNIPETDLEALLSIACPNVLFPYAREVVSDLAIRSGLPSVILQPVNFEALYASRQQQESENQPSGDKASAETLQ